MNQSELKLKTLNDPLHLWGRNRTPSWIKSEFGTRGYDSEKLDCGWLRSVGRNCALTAVKIGIVPNASDVFGSFGANNSEPDAFSKLCIFLPILHYHASGHPNLQENLPAHGLKGRWALRPIFCNFLLEYRFLTI